MLASLLRSNRLTLLSCDAGAARDGLLRRGLMPVLQPTHLPDGWTERGLRFDAWGALPLQALREQIERVLPLPPTMPEPATLAEQLTLAGEQHRVRLLLVLDAFEQHLREPAQRADIARFDAELSSCVADPAVPLHVLLVVDDAMRPSLARLARQIPELGRGNWVRLPEGRSYTELVWSDTTVEEPARGAATDDDDVERDDEWALDLLLDDPPASSPVPPTPPAPNYIVRSAPPKSAPPRAPMPEPPAPTPTWLTDEVSFAAVPSPEPEPARVPRWATEPDAQTLRRTQRPWWRRGSTWLVLNVGLLLAVIGLALGWLGLGEGLPLLRGSGDDPVARVQTPPAPPVPPPRAEVAPAPPTTIAPPAAPPAQAPRPLTLTRPIDGGASGAMLDELVRRVAAPAGIVLQLVPSDAPATLAVWRPDAIVAAPGGQTPLRVLAPLYSEQIQVIVRNDASWDYAHQIKGLRVNIGPPGSARARTARSLYQLMFDGPIPPGQVNELDEAAALRQMLNRGGPIDAMIVVSEVPLLNRLPAAARSQLRELPFDAKDRRVAGALQNYPLKRRTGNDRQRPAVTSFLVTGPEPHPYENELRALVAAICRQQPALQARGSPLLRGFAQGEQPAVGLPYVLPHQAGGACPSAPAAADARRSDARAMPLPLPSS